MRMHGTIGPRFVFRELKIFAFTWVHPDMLGSVRYISSKYTKKPEKIFEHIIIFTKANITESEIVPFLSL